MLSILESAELGGMIGRTATAMAVPIPGAGVVLAPVGSAVGEVVGMVAPKVNTNKLPTRFKDSVQIYKAGGEENVSLSPADQIELRKKYQQKAKELGYNKIGQVVATIDPGSLSLIPNIIVKK